MTAPTPEPRTYSQRGPAEPLETVWVMPVLADETPARIRGFATDVAAQGDIEHRWPRRRR